MREPDDNPTRHTDLAISTSGCYARLRELFASVAELDEAEHARVRKRSRARRNSAS